VFTAPPPSSGPAGTLRLRGDAQAARGRSGCAGTLRPRGDSQAAPGGRPGPGTSSMIVRSSERRLCGSGTVRSVCPASGPSPLGLIPTVSAGSTPRSARSRRRDGPWSRGRRAGPGGRQEPGGRRRGAARSARACRRNRAPPARTEGRRAARSGRLPSGTAGRHPEPSGLHGGHGNSRSWLPGFSLAGFSLAGFSPGGFSLARFSLTTGAGPYRPRSPRVLRTPRSSSDARMAR